MTDGRTIVYLTISTLEGGAVVKVCYNHECLTHFSLWKIKPFAWIFFCVFHQIFSLSVATHKKIKLKWKYSRRIENILF